MNRIVERSNWGYFDCLDGTDIEDLELLRIQWPDGTVKEYEVTLERDAFSGRSGGCGAPESYPVNRATIVEQIHGRNVVVRIHGMLAERVDRKERLLEAAVKRASARKRVLPPEAGEES